MISWGEQQRQTNPYIFCETVMVQAQKPILIISDARRKTDLEYFQKVLKKRLLLIRIEANEEIRKKRGWKFINGIDDADSECNLDDLNHWDYIIENDNNNISLKRNVQNIVDEVMKYVS